MAKANKIGAINYAVLRMLQNGNCARCAQKLDAPFWFESRFGSILIDDERMIEATLAHITPKSKGGSSKSDAYAIEHLFCNRQYDNLNPEIYYAISGGLSFAQVIDNAQRARIITKEFIAGRRTELTAMLAYEMRIDIVKSSEWVRRYAPQVRALGLEDIAVKPTIAA